MGRCSELKKENYHKQLYAEYLLFKRKLIHCMKISHSQIKEIRI